MIVIKPAVIVDMDEVLADCVGSLLFIYNRLYQADITVEDITDWKLPDEMTRLFRLPRFFRNLNPIPNAAWGLQQLVKLGYHPIIVTDCGGDDDVKCQKIEWLSEHMPLFVPYINFTNDKSTYNGWAMIDDAPHHLASFRGKYKICMDRPWNRQFTYSYRVIMQDWEAIVKIFKHLRGKW